MSCHIIISGIGRTESFATPAEARRRAAEILGREPAGFEVTLVTHDDAIVTPEDSRKRSKRARGRK